MILRLMPALGTNSLVLYVDNMRKKLRFLLCVLLLLTVGFTVACGRHADEETDFKSMIQPISKEDLSAEGIYVGVTKAYHANAIPKPSAFRGIAVSPSGTIAVLPFDNFDTIRIYDEYGEYLYSFHLSGGAGGTFDAEWEDEDLWVYWSRSMVAMRISQDGEIRFLGKYTNEFRKHRDEVSLESISTFVDREGVQFTPAAENWLVRLSTIRTRIIRVEPDGKESIIYQAAADITVEGIFFAVVILGAVAYVIYKNVTRK